MPDPSNRLLERERRSLQLAARGCTNERIAGLLEVSVSTVKSDLRSAVSKLRARGRTHAVVLAIRQQIIPCETDGLAGELPPHLLRILSAVAEGGGPRDIAIVFDLSVHTVKTYLRQLHAEFGTTSRAQTVAAGIQRGLL